MPHVDQYVPDLRHVAVRLAALIQLTFEGGLGMLPPIAKIQR
jgi:hypothetical protein